MKKPGLYFCIFLHHICLFAQSHQLIIKFSEPVHIEEALAGFDIISSQQIPGESIYRVTIDTNLDIADIIDTLHLSPYFETCEENQVGRIDSPDAAARIDQRPIFILDQRPIFILDDGSAGGSALTSVYGQGFLDQINARSAWSRATGAGALVAIVDTGVDLDHAFLQGNVELDGYDFVDDDADPREERADIDSNGNGLVDEGWGHGSHIAGIVKLVAPDARLLPIRVVDSDGQADLFSVLLGLEYALSQGADVINLSLSIPEPSQLLQEWILKAKNANALVVTSAGNDNHSNLEFPATEMAVLSVASVNENNLKSDFSNYSFKVDVAAPGEAIISCLPGGGFTERWGTSMAAPMVSGQAALIVEHDPYARFFQLKGKIKTRTENISFLNPSYLGMLGTGLIDVDASLSCFNHHHHHRHGF